MYQTKKLENSKLPLFKFRCNSDRLSICSVGKVKTGAFTAR